MDGGWEQTGEGGFKFGFIGGFAPEPPPKNLFEKRFLGISKNFHKALLNNIF